MGAWNDSEKIARKQLNLSDHYLLVVASSEVSDINLEYQDEIFAQCENDIGLGSLPEMIMEILDKHITYLTLRHV